VTRLDIKFDHLQTIEPNPNQGVTIPHGVVHRTRAPRKTVMLMVETNEIRPTGD
jgi:mannose-6-phosphate isomerase-like protein (cupin superfamily)